MGQVLCWSALLTYTSKDRIRHWERQGQTPGFKLAMSRTMLISASRYHSGGDFFSGALQTCAASSLVLWLEEDPTAGDVLAQHFPLSTILEEAEYNTLHKIIIGLRVF